MDNDLINMITNGRGPSETHGLASNPSSFRNLQKHSDGGSGGGSRDEAKYSESAIDMLHQRQLENGNNSSTGTASYFGGLNLIGRSQSAAPETWEYGKIPSSTKSAVAPSSAIGNNVTSNEDGIFGSRSRFFSGGGEDLREGMGLRRPASTGVIERPHGAAEGDVASILETLGLADSQPNTSNNTMPSLGGSRPGGSGSSLVMGAHSPNTKSIMEKIHEKRELHNNSRAADYFIANDGEAPSSSSNDLLSKNQGSSQMGGDGGGLRNNNNGKPLIQQQYQQALVNEGDARSNITPMIHTNHHVQQQQPQQTTLQRQVIYQHQQDPPHHEPQQQQQQQQQQVYYQPQVASSQNNYQDYRSVQHQQNVLHNTTVSQMNPPQLQPTIYHMNAPAPSQYSFQYHSPHQAHLAHGVPANHHILGVQPQYISLVPVQPTGHPHIVGGPSMAVGHGGHPTYAYVHYAGGDGNSGVPPPTLIAAAGGAPATTFVMGPNGPIAVSSTLQPVNATSYSDGGHRTSSSPTGSNGMRVPSRGTSSGRNGARTPERPRSAKKNLQFSGSRRHRVHDKHGAMPASAPSRLGPEAAGLLADIRAGRSRAPWTVHDVRGHVVEFCLDQNGSRFIQQRLEVAADEEKELVVEEVVLAIVDLQNDVFGNYVVQKLYEFGNEKMKNSLRGTLDGNMLLLSLQMYGCRVVQKALETLPYQDLCELLTEFESYVLTCIQDQNGNHVIQKAIEVMSLRAHDAAGDNDALFRSMAHRLDFIVDDVLANARTLCCHPYGCRVLQRMLEHCVDFQKEATLDKIRLCHKVLLDDQYGNYVIQHACQYGRESDRDSLLEIIVENDLLKLSRQKFASNVVEKLLKYGNAYQRNAIVREMLKVVNEGAASQEGVGTSVLLLMVRDAYANYVVQTAIDVVPEGNEKRMLLEELKANEEQLRNYTFAKHIVAKLGTK